MRVLYFAQARTAAGVAEESLLIPSALGEAALWERLTGLHPALAPLRANTRLARNGEFTTLGELFHDADEVALIPPVSGG